MLNNNGQNYVAATDFQRHTLDYNYSKTLSNGQVLTLKGALSYFNRNFTETQKFFNANQVSSYTELSDFWQLKKHKIIFGANLTSENFRKPKVDSTQFLSYSYQTKGFFAQDDWQITSKIALQVGFRFDNHNKFGNFVLPRISIMAKPSEKFTIRCSVGTGYKTPNIFANQVPATSNTEISYWNLMPIYSTVKPEHSIGSNLDIAYSTRIGEKFSIQIDQAFYFTNIFNPVVAQYNNLNRNSNIGLTNAGYRINSIGTDTYFRMQYDVIELYLGYNHTIAKYVGGNQNGIFVPFSPQDKFSLTAAYTIEGKWRFGIENAFIGNQYLYSNQRVRNYVFWAAAAERKFGSRFSLIINAENIGNIKQANYEKVVTGGLQNPTFAPIWAPQEGMILNMALKFSIIH